MKKLRRNSVWFDSRNDRLYVLRPTRFFFFGDYGDSKFERLFSTPFKKYHPTLVYIGQL